MILMTPSALQVITGVLLDHGVPHEKILTTEWNPDVELGTLDPFGHNGLGKQV